MSKRANQYKPLPPLEDIKPFMVRYYKFRWDVKKIHRTIVEKHLDREQYGIGLTRFRKYMVDAGLPGVRVSGHTPDSIRPVMVELRAMYPKAGALEMRNLLFHEHMILASRPYLVDYFRLYEPHLIAERKAKNLKRKRFWAAGVNDLVVFDQHDKWKGKFGLALHIGLDPFAGLIKWICIWWSNSHPRLIFSYYINEVEASGYMPLISQSDLGSENYGIANGQTMLRQLHDPSLVGTLQHRWKREWKNVIPEIAWSQLRRRWTPGFENILDLGVNRGWYDPLVPRQNFIFRWVFIPWLQAELDLYKDRVNLQNVPIATKFFHTIQVKQEHIDYVRQLYAPADHVVFQLVPPTFDRYCHAFYATLGSPTITRDNVWDVYLDILAAFSRLDTPEIEPMIPGWNAHHTLGREDVWDHDPLILMEGTELLPPGGPLANQGTYNYQGGVNGGAGLGPAEIARLNALEGEEAGDPNEVLEGPVNAAYFSDEEEDWFEPDDFNDI
ncbi:hypothetical protein C8J56DRAFT_1140717 [Mycena floridula]|nr:hypothetical protein C8J56DRAFT_1140717 [Mycena floridula]